eukprot:TRINITY_DN13797_c0_g2_i2.p1 TRINITY_DN13797_c0_g2~~TRINITY_DN13797_c0_g2_i2.p1  ORF type:complete len:246 (+),score=34.59 TRINITY_DN13797_c0_g2_i2:3-740(+)
MCIRDRYMGVHRKLEGQKTLPSFKNEEMMRQTYCVTTFHAPTEVESHKGGRRIPFAVSPKATATRESFSLGESNSCARALRPFPGRGLKAVTGNPFERNRREEERMILEGIQLRKARETEARRRTRVESFLAEKFASTSKIRNIMVKGQVLQSARPSRPQSAVPERRNEPQRISYSAMLMSLDRLAIQEQQPPIEVQVGRDRNGLASPVYHNGKKVPRGDLKHLVQTLSGFSLREEGQLEGPTVL